jgi:hypothetical protein
MLKICMKGLMVMIILLATLFLVLKHVEHRPLPFSAPHMPPSLLPLSVPAQLLSFSSDEDGIRPWKTRDKEKRENLKFCYGLCRQHFYGKVQRKEFALAWDILKVCYRRCKGKYGIR